MDGEAVEAGVEDAAADIVDHDVDALASGQRLHLLREILAVAGDDHLVGADPFEEAALVLAAGDAR